MIQPRAPVTARKTGIILTGIAVLTACSPERSDSPLPERSGAANTTALPPSFRGSGGPVLLRLTGWADSVVVQEIVDAGLRPLPGRNTPERIDTLGMNVVGGTIPPNGLDRILALQYLVSIEPVPQHR